MDTWRIVSSDLEEWVRRGYAAFNRRDWEAIARGLPDDFEMLDHIPPESSRRRGPNAMREVTDANADTAFADLQYEPVEVLVLEPEPDSYLVLVRVHATGSGGSSGAPVETEVAQIWTLRGGIAQRCEQFRTWDEARAAAGLD